MFCGDCVAHKVGRGSGPICDSDVRAEHLEFKFGAVARGVAVIGFLLALRKPLIDDRLVVDRAQTGQRHDADFVQSRGGFCGLRRFAPLAQ